MSIPNGSGKIEFADSLRGVAALAVVAAHQIGLFWHARDVAAAQSHMPILPVERFPTPVYANWVEPIPGVHLSMVGVALFFLVSGFVIPFSFQKASGPAFLVGRAFRLFPTFAAAITVTLLMIFLGAQHFGLDWPYPVDQIAFNYVLGLRDMTSAPPVDGVIWTLEVEIKFYLLCAIIAPLLRNYSRLVFLIPVLLFVPSLVFWLCVSGLENPYVYGYSYIVPFAVAKCAQYVIFMFIGVAFHYFYMKRLSVQQLGCLAIFLLSLLWILWISARDLGTVFVGDYAIALVVFGACMKFHSCFEGGRIIRFFAAISYPLYLCHCVVGYAALRVLLDVGAKNWVANATVFAGAVLVAWLIHAFVEMPSHKLGRRLVTRLSDLDGPVGLGAMPTRS